MRVVLDLSADELLEIVRALETRCSWYVHRQLAPPPAAASASRKVALLAEDLELVEPGDPQ